MFDVDVAVEGDVPTPDRIYRLIAEKRAELDCLEIALHAVLYDREQRSSDRRTLAGKGADDAENR